jgi:sigma-B regulation protein RsbU (phosphoserine phosphatase)
VLQASLLPPHLPTIDGLDIAACYRAGAADVGGDFYDIFPVQPGQWGLVIGDVCGRGPEAATRTALTRYTVRSVASAAPRAPAEVLALLNQALLADDPEGRFCTAVVGRVTPGADGTVAVDLASGGHPPALVARADGSIEELEAFGPILGIVAEVAFVPLRATLEPGDVLVLYTDGLVEARARGRFFGAERVARLAAEHRKGGAGAVAGALDRASAEFAGEGVVDDVAILALGVPGLTAG